jgi:hypothetical protein
MHLLLNLCYQADCCSSPEHILIRIMSAWHMTQAGLQPLLLTQEHCKGEPSLVALFTFVARHPLTKKSTQLNALKPQTAEEKQQFEERQAVADARKAARNVSASAQPQGERLLQRDRSMLAAQVQSTGPLWHPNMIPELPVPTVQAATDMLPMGTRV